MTDSRERFGLILPTPVYGKDYIQGSPIQLRGTPIREDGQWDAFLPPFEKQKKSTETQACATFNTLACVEILQRAIFNGLDTEWSDRFTAKMSGTTKQGNDPHKVAETLRTKGCVYEEEWPFTDSMTWDEFYAGIPMDIQLRGQIRFKRVYSFGHEYAKTDPESMMDALRYSPLGVDVDAWNEKNGIYYRKHGSNHWVCIYGYKKGKYWKCYDSYDDFTKKIDWNFGFSVVKRYTLEKSVEVSNPTHPLYLWWQAIKWLKNFFRI